MGFISLASISNVVHTQHRKITKNIFANHACNSGMACLYKSFKILPGAHIHIGNIFTKLDPEVNAVCYTPYFRSLILKLGYATVHGITKSETQPSNWNELNWGETSVAEGCSSACPLSTLLALGSLRETQPSSSYWQNMTQSQWYFLLSLLGTTSPGYHWDLVPLGASRESQNMDLGHPVVGAESRAQCSWGPESSKEETSREENVGVPHLRNVAIWGSRWDSSRGTQN